MAQKQILPYREEIIAMKQPPHAKTHEEVIAHLLDNYGVRVSKSSVTRFLQQHAPHLTLSRTLTPQEEQAVMPLEVLLRMEAEIIAMREEQRTQLDDWTARFGGKLASLSAEIKELERAVTQPDNPSMALLRQIWTRALIITASISGVFFLLLSVILWLSLR